MCASFSLLFTLLVFLCVSLTLKCRCAIATRREIKFTLMATIIFNYVEPLWQKEQHVQTGSLHCNALLGSEESDAFLRRTDFYIGSTGQLKYLSLDRQLDSNECF